tara:strand:- start:726 stop:2897 length:2172 start_codon:yes stop_codon:yes gene_type:complete
MENKNILINYTMSYNEKINKEVCDYLLQLSNDDLKNVVYDNYQQENESGATWNVITYIKQVKIWLKIMKNNNYTKRCNYKYSTTLKDKGRLFVKGFGVQSLQYRLRGALLNGINKDYDMVNAHPVILKYICDTFFPDEIFSYLSSYVENRDKLIKKHNFTKKDILISINSDKKIRTTNNFVLGFDEEMKSIQQLVKNNPIYNICSPNDKNPNGSLLNMTLCIIENEILQLILDYCNEHKIAINTLMFDGLTIDTDIDLTEIFNNLCKKYNIKWKIKEHINDIQIDKELIDNNPYLYEKVKEEFEVNNFMIKTPLKYGEEYYQNGIKKVAFYTKADFIDITAKYLIEGKRDDNVHILNTWLADDNKRSYRSVDFLPYPRFVGENIYNIFYGLKGDTLEGNEKGFNKILDHIKILVDYDDLSYDYVLKYIAHMIQFPGLLPRVALLFKSDEGVGKNLFFNKIAEYFLNAENFLETNRIEQVVGKFNLISKKLLVCLDEVNGASAFSRADEIKSIITQEIVNWEEKSKNAIQIQNCARYIFFTNNNCPLKVGLTDRRFCCFASSNEKANDNDYFNDLLTELDDNDSMYSFYHYLKNMDISKFDLNCRPRTDYYDELKSVNVPIVANFLQTKFENNKKDKVIIRALDFFTEFKFFLSNYHRNIDITNNKFGRDIKNFKGIQKKKTNICAVYEIEPKVLVEYLGKIGYIEELELIDDKLIPLIDSDLD